MEDELTIRKSEPADLERIMEVYEEAKKFMRSKGNPNQWNGNYPDFDTIFTDISAGNHYVAEDCDGNLYMVFSFIIGEDPTYTVIENGEWLNKKPYGTIHRIASSGLKGGMMERCVRYCAQLIDNIRVDTCAENGLMLSALHRLGFSCCGVIYTKDDSPRLAFQKDYRPQIKLDIKF